MLHQNTLVSSESRPLWWDERAAAVPPHGAERFPPSARGGVAARAAARDARPLAYVDLDCAYLRSLVLQALARRPGWRVLVAAHPASAPDQCTSPADTAFCWSEYERTDWARVLAGKQSSAAYCVRKGLIRKSQWAYNVAKYVAKRPNSALAHGVPETHLLEFRDIDYIDVRAPALAHVQLLAVSVPPAQRRRRWRRCTRCETCPTTAASGGF